MVLRTDTNARNDLHVTHTETRTVMKTIYASPWPWIAYFHISSMDMDMARYEASDLGLRFYQSGLRTQPATGSRFNECSWCWACASSYSKRGSVSSFPSLDAERFNLLNIRPWRSLFRTQITSLYFTTTVGVVSLPVLTLNRRIRAKAPRPRARMECDGIL